METIKLRTHINADGVLKIDIPPEYRDTELEVLVVLQPIIVDKAVALGYPSGFFERTFGSITDETFERAPQGEFETRDEVK